MSLMLDPFAEISRLTQRVAGSAMRPAAMPMDAWREADRYIVEFDVPGIKPESLDLNVDHDVLTVRAERPDGDTDRQWLTAERPHGVFSRQLMLGKNLDAAKIEASYTDGVLRLTIPVAEQAKPHKVAIRGAKQSVDA